MKHKLRLLIEKISGYWFYKVKHLPMGTSLRIDINKFNYSSLETVFDVGANIGQTYKRFRTYYPKSKIYCFEPIQSTFNKLKKNVSQNKLTIIENFAFGEEIGEKKVALYEDWDVLNSLQDKLMNKSADAKIEMVRIDTIQNYCEKNDIKNIDLLKIDTEGYELNILKGAVKMLEQSKISFILCEVGFLSKNLRNTNFFQLSEYLAQYEYYFVSMYNGTNENWSKGLYFGDALFAHSKLKFN